jgi:hypothetical protein
MENKDEIIVNDTPTPKVRKPLTEAQKAVKKKNMRIYYAKMKAEPEYIQRHDILNVNDFRVEHIIINIKRKY